MVIGKAGQWLLALALLLGSGSVSMAASLEATVSAQTVVEGESIALYLEGVDVNEMPDVSALYAQFDVLDSRSSEQHSIINGNRTAKTIWRFELMAKNTGTSIIPAFVADGLSTQPIAVRVQARGTPGAQPRDNIFIELSVDKTEPWVQGQIVLTVKLYDGTGIASGTLSDPEAPDLEVVRLQDNRQQPIVERDGIEYQVITRRYALFPQRSGEFVVPPLQLNANVRDIDRNSQRRYSRPRRITIRSESLTLNVKPKPPQSSAGWWLPVQEINLTSQWSSDIGQGVVGEPLTRTLVLTALGATQTQLPEIPASVIDGIRIYPDTPALESQPLENGVISARQQKWSVIPQRAGTMTLPAITVKWWDTTHDAERETVLPEEQIVVVEAAADGLASTQPALTADNAVGSDSSEANLSQPQSLASGLSPHGGQYWMWIAIVACCGWLATVSAWLLRGRRAGRAGNARPVATLEPAADRLLAELASASQTADPAVFRAALLRWARQYWPQDPPVNPAQIGDRLDSPELAGRLRQLDASMYSASPARFEAAPVFKQLQRSIAAAGKSAPDVVVSPLPQL